MPRRATKIVATTYYCIGDPVLLEKIDPRWRERGSRLNFSHGKARTTSTGSGGTAKVAQRAEVEVAIMADLQGKNTCRLGFARRQGSLPEGAGCENLCWMRRAPRRSDVKGVGLDYKELRVMSRQAMCCCSMAMIVLTVDAVLGRRSDHHHRQMEASCPSLTRASTSGAAG
jgi:pyruvate kinase